MIFKRIVSGVDGSDEGDEACRLASRLCAPDGRLVVVAVAETPYAFRAGLDAAEWTWRLRAAAKGARDSVLREFAQDARVRAEVREGHAADELLDALDDVGADLLAIGRHGRGRVAGAMLGGVATTLIHAAQCSVLVVPRGASSKRFPRTILVGIDGSPSSGHARTVADALAARSGGSVVAEHHEHDPVDALVSHCRDSDLLVVGSRGLHGVRSLGSVAERVAHRATCPVLIVRGEPVAPACAAPSAVEVTA